MARRYARSSRRSRTYRSSPRRANRRRVRFTGRRGSGRRSGGGRTLRIVIEQPSAAGRFAPGMSGDGRMVTVGRTKQSRF